MVQERDFSSILWTKTISLGYSLRWFICFSVLYQTLWYLGQDTIHCTSPNIVHVETVLTTLESGYLNSKRRSDVARSVLLLNCLLILLQQQKVLDRGTNSYYDCFRPYKRIRKQHLFIQTLIQTGATTAIPNLIFTMVLLPGRTPTSSLIATTIKITTSPGATTWCSLYHHHL